MADLPPHVNADHRATLRRILDHSAQGNLEWRQVRSLLEAVGTVVEDHNGKLDVRVGDETLVLRPPHGKDVDRETIAELRRMLTRADIRPDD
jgi:hypothetical protein